MLQALVVDYTKLTAAYEFHFGSQLSLHAKKITIEKKNKTKKTELEDFEAKTHKLGKSQGKNAMGREKSDQCKRLDETECSKAREKKKLRENATNVENGKMEQQQGGWVKCNKTKGRENRTCA